MRRCVLALALLLTLLLELLLPLQLGSFCSCCCDLLGVGVALRTYSLDRRSYGWIFVICEPLNLTKVQRERATLELRQKLEGEQLDLPIIVLQLECHKL